MTIEPSEVMRNRIEVSGRGTEDSGLHAASPDFNQSLARGLAVICTFDAENVRLSLSDVARRVGIARASASRFLRTLETLGYVSRVGRLFELTPRVLELGFSYLSALSLPEVMQPHLERLSRELDESVSAAVLDGPDVIYVARVYTRRIMSVRITIGTRFPAHATSLGRVLLGRLPEPALRELLVGAGLQRYTPRTVIDVDALVAEVFRAHDQGWALVDSELEHGLRSIAVPVQDRTGSVVAALNVSTNTQRVTEQTLLDKYLPTLRDAAAAIEADLRLV